MIDLRSNTHGCELIKKQTGNNKAREVLNCNYAGCASLHRRYLHARFYCSESSAIRPRPQGFFTFFAHGVEDELLTQNIPREVLSSLAKLCLTYLHAMFYYLEVS